MINRKNSIILSTLLVAVFSGCGEDRSHPAGVDANGNPIEYKAPTAIIELNSTTNQYVPALGEYTVDRTNLAAPFIFDGLRSQDNDENNQSIATYAWKVSHTFSAACVDINTSTKGKAIFKFANTDTNSTCAREAIDNGEINVTLTVTDDENVAASAMKTIKTN